MVDTGAAMIDRMVALDTNTSKLQWTGKKILGMHTGAVAFSSGSVSLAKNIPVAGMFTINMTTITSDAGEKLITHLKSEDFFNVSGFNNAILKLMKITPASGTNMYDVVAALTIKGITNAITFPAVIVVTDAQVTAKASFTIDRTKWNIKYGSASVFADIGDKAIEDKIGFDVDVVLK